MLQNIINLFIIFFFVCVDIHRETTNIPVNTMMNKVSENWRYSSIKKWNCHHLQPLKQVLFFPPFSIEHKQIIITLPL